MHYDLIVIGMGLSGLMAAKTAVEAGMKVLIAGKGTGSLCLFSNTIDVLGSLPKDMTMVGGLSSWIKDHPQHPYSKAGMRNLEDAFASFISFFPRPYSFQSINGSNSLVPTCAGTFRPTYLLPPTMLAGITLSAGKGLIIGFRGYKDFFGNLVADLLGCRGITLSLPEAPSRELTAAALARLIEKEGFKAALGREIRQHLHGEKYVGLPALLGLHEPIRVKQDLEEMIGVQVFEIPTLPPSIPGRRVFDRFKAWLIQRGATWLLGQFVSSVSLKDKRCEAIYVSNPPVLTPYAAERFILATGRFVGGGLMASEERISEPIFNLPVAQPGSREDWFGKSFFSDHPIHQSGILTDSSFRPIDEQGDLILENVQVAGSILAHHNLIEEKSREGIEIATGYAAAKCALGR